MVLKFTSEYLECSSNCAQKVFAQMSHNGLVLEISIVELLPELLQLEETNFGFVVLSRNEEGNGLNSSVGNSSELFSGVNQSVGRNRGLGCYWGHQ